jgi:hypothetical protein
MLSVLLSRGGLGFSIFVAWSKGFDCLCSRTVTRSPRPLRCVMYRFSSRNSYRTKDRFSCGFVLAQ